MSPTNPFPQSELLSNISHIPSCHCFKLIKHDSVPGRILQLLQGLMVDGVHAVVDKGAAQKHSQGEDP